MDYAAVYDRLIERARSRDLAEYTERHHVVPRCLGGSDDDMNVVCLTPEEHFVCHQLLAKMHPKHFGLNAAALAMCGGHEARYTNRTYGWLKKRYSEFMRGPNNPGKKAPRTGAAHHFYGKKLPPDFISAAGKRSISEKNSGSKNAMYGVKPWNHPRATLETRSVWRIADTCMSWLAIAERKNMYQMCKALGHLVLNPKPHRFGAVIEYLDKGWDPMTDPDWLTFRDLL